MPAPAITRINVRPDWPLVVLLISLTAIVAISIVVLVVHGDLPTQALYTLAAWFAGLVKGALIPAFRYYMRDQGVDFAMGRSGSPPPPSP